MKKSLNKNVHYVELSLPASGSEAAPVTAQIPLVGDLVSRVVFAASAPTGAYARVLDIEHQIVPVSGFMFVNNAWNDVKIDREIEGPPWILEVHAYNPGAGTTVLYVLVEVGDSKEKDLDALILGQLEAINEKLTKR